MKMFLKNIAVFIFCVLACIGVTFAQTFQAPVVKEKADFGNIPIIQGATTETETQITILLPKLKYYRVKAFTKAGKELTIQRIEEIRHSQDLPHWKIQKFHITGLQVGEEYTLKVQDEKFPDPIDERTFKAFDTTMSSPRFVFGSCMTDDFRFANIRRTIWDQVAAQKPDFVVLNGDLVYVDGFEFVARDVATELDIWQRYIDNTLSIPFFRMKQLVPVYANWDDHDSGTNDSNREFKGLPLAHRAFKAFFGSHDVKGFYENGPGVSSILNLRNQRLILLDARTFRAPPNAPNEPHAQLGAEQHQWLMKHLRANDNAAWLIMGDQFFADPVERGINIVGHRTLNESYLANHAEDFKSFVAELATVKAPIVFGSGDIHFSEILGIDPEHLGYRTFEIASSPFHSYIYRDSPPWNNPRRLEGTAIKDHNFALIESSPNSAGKWTLNVQFIGAHGKAFVSRCLEVMRDLGKQTREKK